MKNPHDVVMRALITEKGTKMREGGNRYLFQVHPDANKIEIKDAIEQVFDVTVEKVRTQNVIGKLKRLGRNVGRRPAWKKAIVTLKEGDNIDLFEEV
jgi:large subunit ribosomal protein L23